MKKSNVIIAVGLIAVCLIGWLAVGSQVISKNSSYSKYVEEADAWVEKGLYQRAISNYNLALEEKETPEIYEKINYAYQLRYAEAPEETLEDYMDFLQAAVSAYPGNGALVDSYVEIYYSQSEYEDIYNCLINAIQNGYDNETVQSMLLSVKYAFKLRRSEFAGIKQSVGDIYTTARNDGWNIYSIEEGYLLSNEYTYVSRCNEDGVFVVTGEDSRLMDSTGMVLGIFEAEVNDAGLLANELIPACCGGIYDYYNDLAEKQFGGYEMAGTFQDGFAAVKKDGKWMLIDTNGEVVSGVFDEIVLDNMGRYNVGGVVIAKADGIYGLYNEKMELEVSLDCTAVDVCTEDGVIAICKDNQWGFVDKEGNIIIEPIYEQAKSFSNGLAAVHEDGKWGFIDLQGNLVIDYQFSDVGYMSSTGLCPVRTDMPEEKAAQAEGEGSEIIETQEIWKMLELEIGIKED